MVYIIFIIRIRETDHMPHSSGGGGGSFGGGGGSFGGGSSGGSGGSGSRTSRSYFPGATRYVYYSGGSAHYIYSNSDPAKAASPLRFLTLLFYIPFFLAIIPLVMDIYHVPQKMETDYDTKIVVEDNAGVLGNTEELDKALEAFFDETGIAPSFVTIYNEDWHNRYSDLETYAYNYYVDNFKDENHWLIVYSEPQAPKANDHYYWEGMQGDNTDPILTEECLKEFNEHFNNLLAEGERPDVAGSATQAFNNITPKIMKPYFDSGNAMFACFFIGFILLHFLIMAISIIKAVKYKNAVPISLKIGEKKCPSCGGGYVKGTCDTCPHCGAPIDKEEDIDIKVNSEPDEGGIPMPPSAVTTPMTDPFAYSDQDLNKIRAEDIEDSELPLSQRIKGIFKTPDEEE